MSIYEYLEHKPVVVTDIEELTVELTLQPSFNSYRVLANGMDIGLFDKFSGYNVSEFPLSIRGRRVSLSNGQVITVYNKSFALIERWVKHSNDGEVVHHKPRIIQRYTTAVRVRSPFEDRYLRWREAARLTVGTRITMDVPFQWYGKNLTNGKVFFPKQRPQGREWLEYDIPAIPENGWRVFLETLEGKYLSDVLLIARKFDKPSGTRSASPETASARALRIANAKMWRGDINCESVSFGKNVLFILRRAGKQPVYIVDNPGVGALYVFRDHAEARALASGMVSRTDAARGRGIRIIHRSNWEEQIAKIVEAAWA
jgi:hypothetical protein